MFRPARQDGSRTRAWCGCPAPSIRPEDFVQAGFDAGSHGAASTIDLQFVDLELDHLGDRERHRAARPRYRAAGARGGLPLRLARRYLARRLVRLGLRGHRCRAVGRTVLAGALSRQPPADRRKSLARRAPRRLAAGAACGVRRRTSNMAFHSGARRRTARRCTWAMGGDDRFAQGHDLMAQALPPAAVHVIGGRPRLVHLVARSGNNFWI